MIFTEIPYGSEAYQAECQLRHEVLRVAIGLSLHNEDLSNERNQLHFGLFDEDELVACVIAVPLSATEAKIRQMAVSQEHQGKGCGRRVIEGLERHLAVRGVTHFSMHARMSAVGFYEKLGYSKVGEKFTEVGIPHVRMEKVVGASNCVDLIFLPPPFLDSGGHEFHLPGPSTSLGFRLRRLGGGRSLRMF